MKKLLLSLTVLSMSALAFTACGGEDEEQEDLDEEVEEVEEEVEDVEDAEDDLADEEEDVMEEEDDLDEEEDELDDAVEDVDVDALYEAYVDVTLDYACDLMDGTVDPTEVQTLYEDAGLEALAQDPALVAELATRFQEDTDLQTEYLEVVSGC